MKNITKITSLIVCFFLCHALFAEKSRAISNSDNGAKSSNEIKSIAAGCTAGAAFKYLELNNVRTRINSGGDMWWDLEVSQYEIPKGSRKMSMYAAALWIGGKDVSGNLKVAAQRYRAGSQQGKAKGLVDFYTGPLTLVGATVDAEVCKKYDKLFSITRDEVDKYVAWIQDPTAMPDYQTPASILEYPAHGDGPGYSKYLAPFFDGNEDGEYTPGIRHKLPNGEYAGDYPYYDLANKLCHTEIETMEGNGILVDQVLKGDATLWWVFNDRGNVHGESQGGAANQIGMEIRAQAFAFTTADELNDMTFYSYELINRSSSELTETFFCQWVDTDLGHAFDDFVGCDVERGLGYCYNGTTIDGDGQFFAYGSNPPAVGVDFFQGPYMDPDGYDNPSFKGDGIYGPSYMGSCDIVKQDGDTRILKSKTDTVGKPFLVKAEAINGVNFGNGIPDDERFGMRRFLFHNNYLPEPMSDPTTAEEYYNYLTGLWKHGEEMKYGGNAYSGAGVTSMSCDFMFPGDTDPCFWGTNGDNPNFNGGWTEENANGLGQKNDPADRRFMQSAGPFTLASGAVNYITVGIPWARATEGGPFESVRLLKIADDKCQILFDNCFKAISGPNAPDMTVQELDKQIIIYLTNRQTPDDGDNFNESYSEKDPRILKGDSLYRFEGYKIYQLVDNTVAPSDFDNPSKARIIFQCDVKNGVKNLSNYLYDPISEAFAPKSVVSDAPDNGISHTVRITKDVFTNANLINHKQYYYTAVAYGYNSFKKYAQVSPSPDRPGLDGQKEPYLQGRKNVRLVTAIPHIPIGVILNSTYGSGVEVTRIAGHGNGLNVLELTDATIDRILAKRPDAETKFGDEDYPIDYKPVYKVGKGPIDVRIIDPLNVKKGTYEIAFDSLVKKEFATPEQGVAPMEDGKWTLIKTTDTQVGDTVVSATSISAFNEQLFLKYGISVVIQQVHNPGPMITLSYKDAINSIINVVEELSPNNGYLSSEVRFADPSKIWFTGVPDNDNLSTSNMLLSYNWIRSGTQKDQKNPNSPMNDWAFGDKYKTTHNPLGFVIGAHDKAQNYEKILGGTWAPYSLVESSLENFQFGPAYGAGTNNSKIQSLWKDLSSVMLVLTPDKTKWTRCVVIEQCNLAGQAEGEVKRFFSRAGKSVNKEGKTDDNNALDPMDRSDFINPTGMGWFPGYAINVETGERLNIMFGENSDSTLLNVPGQGNLTNGRDMLFNPTSVLRSKDSLPVFGGQHYVYIMSHVEGKTYRNFLDRGYSTPAYDYGAILRTYLEEDKTIYKRHEIQWSNCMWVGFPVAMPKVEWLACDVTIQLNVAKPYARYASTPQTAQGIPTSENNFWPKYQFSTDASMAVTDNIEKKENDLDKINVVPNPYVAGSSYETTNFDNRVRIINLPKKCIVTIYSVNGSLIRQYKFDSNNTPTGKFSASLDWDLKNIAGIPIASGMYFIHVKADGVGERVIKWFGVMRAIDFSGF